MGLSPETALGFLTPQIAESCSVTRDLVQCELAESDRIQSEVDPEDSFASR